MIDLNHGKCAHQGCSRLPSYGAAGTKKREFCAGQATKGMVNSRQYDGGDKGSKRPRRGMSVPPTHSDVRSTPPLLGGGSGGSSSAAPRASKSQHQQARVRFSSRSNTSLGAPDRETSRRDDGSADNRASAGRASTTSQRAAAISEQSAISVRSSSPPLPGSTSENDTCSAAIVKAERVLLSTTVAVDGGSTGEGDTATRRDSDGRSTRKNRTLPSPAQGDTGAGSSGSSISNSRRRGKRARRTVDDDVVVLEPDNEAAAAAGRAADLGRGARVVVKPEQESRT